MVVHPSIAKRGIIASVFVLAMPLVRGFCCFDTARCYRYPSPRLFTVVRSRQSSRWMSAASSDNDAFTDPSRSLEVIKAKDEKLELLLDSFIKAKDETIAAMDQTIAAKDQTIALVTAAKDETIALVTAAKDETIALVTAAKDQTISKMEDLLVEYEDATPTQFESNPHAMTATSAELPAVADTIAHNDYVWEYKDNHWRPYGDAHKVTLEAAFQSQQLKVQISTDKWAYEVDLGGMVQTNVQHHAHTTRPVRRRQLSDVST
jgi:hypothetical protein